MEYSPLVLKQTQASYLSEMVDDVIKSCAPLALDSHHFIVNEVPKNLLVKTDNRIIVGLFNGLLQSVINHSKNSYIRISAKVYTDILILHVRDYNIMGLSSGVYQLQHLDPLVKKVRGFLGVTSHRQGESTVALSFLNLPT